jgi:hypothetical protein
MPEAEVVCTAGTAGVLVEEIVATAGAEPLVGCAVEADPLMGCIAGTGGIVPDAA